MTTIIYWKQGTVSNVMTAEDYDRRDLQSQLVDKYFRQGKTNEQALELARKKIPDPVVISFTSDPLAPLRSDNNIYGHAGYDDLLNQLLRAGGRETATRIMRLRNLEGWNLPRPSDKDIAYVFGEAAVPIFRDYQKSHGY
jgi:hypothetical protein